MRFAHYICAVFLISYIVSGPASASDLIQKRNRGFSQNPQPIEGIAVSAFASNLGDISALAVSDNGNIYITDKSRGRLYELQDRDLDGRMDMSRVLARDFVNPSGLALSQDTLFLSDASAVWSLDLSNGSRQQLASLKNVSALAAPRPMFFDDTKNQLLLALSYSNGTSQILSIDHTSGQASRLSSGTGKVLTFSGINGHKWAGIDTYLAPLSEPEFEPQAGIDINNNNIIGLALPLAPDLLPDGFEPWKDHIFVTLGGDKRSEPGRQVIAVPTSLGQPTKNFQIIVDGFVSNTAFTAWGKPGALALDKRGLFIADSWSGTLWRATKAPPKTVSISPPQLEKKPSLPSHKPPEENHLYGSQIEQASTLELGSTIIDNWEREQLEKKEKSENTEK